MLNDVKDLTLANSQYKLGLSYKLSKGIIARDGKEVAKSLRLAEAAKWMRLAADQGHPEAQCELGICYEWGIGVEQDVIEAKKWFHSAASQGNLLAASHLESLIKQATLTHYQDVLNSSSSSSTDSSTVSLPSVIPSNTALLSNLSLLIPRTHQKKVNNSKHICETNP